MFLVWPGMRVKMRPQSWIFFLQIGLTESMASGAEKNREIIPSTWKNSWKVALEIRGFWPENEGKNEATVLDFFLQIGLTESMVSCAEKDREIIPLTWKNCWKVALEIRGVWPENEGKNEATTLDFFFCR